MTFLPETAAGFRDPAFSKNRQLPLHRWVPWVAGFSAGFVDDCLKKYLSNSPREDTWVLDPFAGVGTTLLEAYTQGLNVIGFEINPYAALAAKLKLEALHIPRESLCKHIAAFERFMEKSCSRNGRCLPRSKPPAGFSGRTELFSPKVERKALFALDFINGIEKRQIRDLFRLAFGSIMVSISNYSYEPSLTRRSAVSKMPIEDAEVTHVLSGKLSLMLRDILWLQDHMKRMGRNPEGNVINASILTAREALSHTLPVDLVITSPPYLNNYHYPRNTRPQIHWLGFSDGPGYSGARESESFGKFWQTVRGCQPVGLIFPFPTLEQIISGIRSLNTEKGAYGGPGWANYVATYFNDTHRFCRVLGEMLRPNGVAVVVLGNSIIQGVEVKTDYFFGMIAEFCGLRFEDTIPLRKKRTGSSIIQSSVRVDKAAAKTVLYESAIVLRKDAPA